jgi:hypothetical protein
MKVLACRFLRGYFYLHLFYITLDLSTMMHLPWFFILLYLLCKTNLLFMIWFHLSQAMVLFWWWCPPGMLWWRWCPLEVLMVLPLSVSLSSICRIQYGLLPPAFFNWDLSYNTASLIGRSLFLSQLLPVFLELLHVCLRRNKVRFCLLHCCDVKVLICGDDERVYIYFLLYMFCSNDLQSKNDDIFLIYSWLACLIGLVQ